MGRCRLRPLDNGYQGASGKAGKSSGTWSALVRAAAAVGDLPLVVLLLVDRAGRTKTQLDDVVARLAASSGVDGRASVAPDRRLQH